MELRKGKEEKREKQWVKGWKTDIKKEKREHSIKPEQVIPRLTSAIAEFTLGKTF